MGQDVGTAASEAAACREGGSSGQAVGEGRGGGGREVGGMGYRLIDACVRAYGVVLRAVNIGRRRPVNYAFQCHTANLPGAVRECTRTKHDRDLRFGRSQKDGTRSFLTA